MSSPAATTHHMPLTWGAEFIDDGTARFRLWAPSVKALSLELDGRSMPMDRDGGWFELRVGDVQPGARYGFRLPDGPSVPDPASRRQAADVHGPSLLVDPTSYAWNSPGWLGRPWEEATIYELHVGTFTAAGTFAAAAERLPRLVDLGITAVELMPVAHFAGDRGWGYDGVLPYAPHSAYGTPDELKTLVDAAHGLGLMVFLDVVYNHFGPEGNYLHSYAEEFFQADRHTPWGPAIAYERTPVRRFFMENALYWLEEFQFDGLRFDAIDNIRDERSDPEFMVEVANEIRANFLGRHIHLMTEDNRNVTHLHERTPEGRTLLHTAEWNDDFHNTVHVLLTGEREGYYADFEADPWGKLARSLAEGFVYQGEHCAHAGGPRGEPSAHLPPTAFVNFLQNHDQVGNRAMGERLAVLADPRQLELFQSLLLLSPQIPLLFMGEEYDETRPFQFFTGFTGELAVAVREGRRREFAQFEAFRGHEDDVPDPNAVETFMGSKLNEGEATSGTGNRTRERFKHLLSTRRHRIVPLLAAAGGHAGSVLAAKEGLIGVRWDLSKAMLELCANFRNTEAAAPGIGGEVVFEDPPGTGQKLRSGRLPPVSIVVTVDQTDNRRTPPPQKREATQGGSHAGRS